MQISAVAKGINEWSGSVLICGILEGRIESQINSFKTIIKDTYSSQRFNEEQLEKLLGDISWKYEKDRVENLAKPKHSVTPITTKRD